MDDFRIQPDMNAVMADPIAYFITWPSHGTWLPGDQRGWVEYRHGWQLPRPQLELECSSRMSEDASRLSADARKIVEEQVAETCLHRGWHLHSARCRSNHVHIVVSANDVSPMVIRSCIKAWCSRRLREKVDCQRANWWAERGSIRWLWNQESLAMVLEYVDEAQDRKRIGDA